MKYFNAAQAAKRIGISDKTIRRWLADGKISAIRTPSNQLAIPESEVEKFRRQRAQFVQEEVDATSHDQIETLAARVAELEQEMARLKGESRSSEKAEKQPVPAPVVPSTRIAKEKAPTRGYKAKDTGLPDGCILASKFAENHGIPRETFIGHMNTGLGPGLIHGPDIPEDTPVGIKDWVRYEERPKRVLKNGKVEKERYLTADQQAAALEFWKRHSVEYNECHDIGCWCHTVKNREE